jgi:hypothetical protein
MAIDFPASPTLNDVFTVGNVTYVWDGTKWTASVTGGISLDKIEEGNTSAEVIDTGSNGRFVVTTEGTERLFVNSSGQVGVGTTPSNFVHLSGSNAAQWLQIDGSASALLIGQNTANTHFGITNGTKIMANNASYPFAIGNNQAQPLIFGTSSVEAMRIDSSQRVGIGTSSPGDFQFYAKSAGAYSAAFETTTDQSSNGAPRRIVFTARNFRPSIEGQFFSGTWQSNDLLINPSGGNVGIGTTSPGAKLQVSETSGTGAIFLADFTASAASQNPLLRIIHRNAANTTTSSVDLYKVYQSGFIIINNDTDASNFTSFTVGASERARIDSSGRLLVGTSAAPNLNNGGGAAARYPAVCFYNTITDPNRRYTAAFIGGADNSNGALIRLGKNRGTSATAANIVNNNDEIGKIDFVGADGTQYVEAARIVCEVDGTPGVNDMPGRIVLSTTADGASSPTERMRIRANGELTTLSSIDAFAPKSTVGAGTSSALIYGRHSATTVNDGTTSFIVWTNGNVQNTNNSYGAISDIKLKENIVDANSQWDDLKALQVRNYNFKEGQTHTQIGLVAQEAELVSPGLVSESPDRDEDGNDLGTVTKSVNYSVLYMKAVKALQEAMERIETLEGMIAVNNITIDEQQHQLSTLAARLTALESA